ncbi:ABC transporter ATP-binding protein [Tropicibacter oceani]|uniref:ATP-binding cassette domain-containing protein n=1 Tax=Tropicibacter oceani TaxID=3058420 RepID=A0ABY8QEE6_9RHOB|nr:ATP-binding cassette domain-containing protein [Tropicibacter oceani]WGW02818.1 ATP-binding cassette domain-containing protein [Tropicibacter oceani]
MAALHLVHDNRRQAAPPVARLSLPGLALGGRAVLGAIDLALGCGETVALTGPSGIGKSTLLRVLAGFETRHRGTVQVPARLAMVFQEPTLLPWRTLRDNLRLTTDISPDEAEKALAEVGLAGRGDDFPGRLSLGQQRRMSLARAFAARPDLLLMDEPFVSLDDALGDEMMTLFETMRARRDVTTLLVTHSTTEAKRLASRILRLEGSPATLSQA